MAGTITTALSNAFKVELLKGTHDFDTSGGSISYQWTATDTDTAGIILGEFEVVNSSGLKETFPNSEPFRVVIRPDFF